VVEACQPRNAGRRGRGKTDSIDAHLAARHEMTNTQTRHINQLRALLRGRDDSERELARGSLPNTRLGEIARRRGHSNEGVEQVVRRADLPTNAWMTTG
jgi:transposase